MVNSATTIRKTPTELTRAFVLSSFENFIKYFQVEYSGYKPNLYPYQLKITNELENVIRCKTRRLIINVPPRYRKCIDPNTNILTSKGIKPAKEIKVGDLLYSYDSGKAVLQPCLGTEPAKKKSIKISMRSGREIICSYDHPMLTTFGYKEAQDIKVGERIKALRCDIDSEYEICDDELIFTTMMIFDGCCSKLSLKFSKGNQEIVDIFKKSANNLGFEIKQYTSTASCDYSIMGGQSGIANQILRKYKIAGHKCYTKRLPTEWFSLSLRQKLLIIELMFITDGYINILNSQGGVTLANKDLILDLQQLLATCNVISSISYKHNEFAGAWALTIPRGEMQKLHGRINFRQKQKSADLVFSKEAVCITDNFPFEIIRKEQMTGQTRKNGIRCEGHKNITRPKFNRLAEKFDCFKKYIDEDFYLDEVVNKTDVGEVELIHLEVNETKNFIANGLVSHNTEIAVKMFIAYGLAISGGKAKFIHVSYAQKLALDNSEAVRDLILSEPFQKLFPEIQIKKDSKAKEKWYTTSGGGVYATSSGGQVTGFGAGSSPEEYDAVESSQKEFDEFFEGFDPELFGGALIIDDPNKADEGDFPLQLARVNNRFDTTISNRVNSRYTPIINIQQRVAPNDLSGKLIKDGGWKLLKLPAIDDDGNVLCESIHTLSELERIKETNPSFGSQYQQDPKPSEGLMYEPFTKVNADKKLVLENAELLFSSTDANMTTGNDYFCTWFWAVWNGKPFVYDVVFEQIAAKDLKEVTVQKHKENKTQLAIIELNNQQTFIGEIQGDMPCTILPITARSNKLSRMIGKAHLSKFVGFISWYGENPSKEYIKAIDHMEKFNKNGTSEDGHDDAEDAFTLGLNYLWVNYQHIFTQ